MKVTVDDLLRIIGRKELEIEQLRGVIHRLQQEHTTTVEVKEEPVKPKSRTRAKAQEDAS